MRTKSSTVKSRHGEEDYAATIRLPIARYKLIKSIGASEERTFAQQVRFVLDRWLAERGESTNGRHQ